MVLDPLPLAVQHPHLVLVVAGSSDGRGRNCLLNTGNVGSDNLNCSASKDSESCARVRAPITGTML